MTSDKPEEETYSLIYRSLKHPIRRKILRMLEERPLTFSEILEAAGIDSGHLSYHLENLGDLITHSSDGKYQLSGIGTAAVELMGDVEEHSHELSKPNMKWTQIFVKVYPLILSGALIIAGLYFISYSTTVTTVTNGDGWLYPNANIPVINLTANFNQTAISILPVNFTSLPTQEINASVVTPIVSLNWTEATPINFTTSWQHQVKPYFYYGIAGLIIASVYPAVFLIRFTRNLRRKPKHCEGR